MKEYQVILYREGRRLGDYAEFSTNKKTTLKENNYCFFSFSTNEATFANWCNIRNIDSRELIKKTKTEVEVIVDGFTLFRGYLYKDPTLERQEDTFELSFEFVSFEYKLAGNWIEPVRRFTQVNADTLFRTLFSEANAEGGYGLALGSADSLAPITREYEAYKPTIEAIWEATDNTTGAGQFDAWIDTDKKFQIRKKRGEETGLVFSFPATMGNIPIIDISYDEPEEYASKIIGLGNGQGDEAIRATAEDKTASNEHGFVAAYVQFSDVSNQSTLQGKVEAELLRRTNPDPSPVITFAGHYVDWRNFKVSDEIGFVNNKAVFYGRAGVVRMLEIEITCDDNDVETAKVITGPVR